MLAPTADTCAPLAVDERQLIIDRIVDNGGIYLADLDRKNVTHLIVNEPKGNKFDAARKWGMYTVTLAWLDQSIERGMILNEECFDPILPPEEQGRYAWVRPSERAGPGRAVKRSLSAVEPGALAQQRKLRKTTSMKLGGHRDNIWGEIMTNDSSARTVFADDRIEVVDSAWDLAAKNAPPEAVFSACCFFIAGFDQWQFDIMSKVIHDLGGAILDEMDDFSMIQDGATRRCLLYVVVPQESRPENHPKMPPPGRLPVRKVTEFFIERCMHSKILFDPRDHVLGRPFPHFPIDDFAGLTMCTSGFAGIDLLHVEKTVRCMGARYAPRLNESVSILICSSLASTRKDKIKLAKEANMPIVRVDWLWSCVAHGVKIPVKDFLFPELRQSPNLCPKPRAASRPESKGGLGSTAQPEASTRPESRGKPHGNTPQVSFAATTSATTTKVTQAAVAPDPEEAATVPSQKPSTARAPSGTEAAPSITPAPTVPPIRAWDASAARTSSPGAATKTPAGAAPPMQAPKRIGEVLDKTAFEDDRPAQRSASSRAPSGHFPRLDTFGSGIVSKPARQASKGTPKLSAPQNSAPKPTEPAEPAKTMEPAASVKPVERVIPETAPVTPEEPDDSAAPPTVPPGAPEQPSDDGYPVVPDDHDHDEHESHQRRRDEDQRAERAAMATSILASKLNSLAGAKFAEGHGDDEGAAKPTRRRKGFVGRAVSNVSAASSGSHDSGPPQQQNAGLSADDESFLRNRSNGSLLGIAVADALVDDLDHPDLQSTQVGYHDVAGAKHKTEMMHRLMAEELGPGAVLPPIPQSPPRRKLLVSTTAATSTTRVTRSKVRR